MAWSLGRPSAGWLVGGSHPRRLSGSRRWLVTLTCLYPNLPVLITGACSCAGSAREKPALRVSSKRVEAVPVPRASLLVIGPDLAFHSGEDLSLEPVRRLSVRPDVPVTVGGGAVGASRDEPGVLVAGVVDHQIEHHPDTQFVGVAEQPREVPETAEPGTDAVVVGDVIAAVPARRGVDRVEPGRRHTQPLQVVQSSREPDQIADTIRVGVLEQPNVHGIDQRAAIPSLRHRRGVCTSAEE